MLATLVLLAQVSIIPMRLDSVGYTTDSVVYRATWAYDTAPGVPMLKIDSLRAHWGKLPVYSRTKKLTPTTRTLTIRFPQRRGYETVERWLCIRYWSGLVPTIRCVSASTAYLVAIILKPDSATLEAAP